MKNKDNKNEKKKKEKREYIKHPLPPKSFLYLFYGLLFPGLGHYMLDRKKRAVIFCASILIFFILGLTMQGHLFRFEQGMNWLQVLGAFASMAAGIPYFIAMLFGWGVGDPASILEPYANYFLLAAGMLNILIAMDAMDISAGRKK